MTDLLYKVCSKCRKSHFALGNLCNECFATECSVDSESFKADLITVNNSLQYNLETASSSVLQVKYSRKLKRVTLERFLCSKIRFHKEKVTLLDLLALYDNMLWLQEKSLKDPNFAEKFGVTLEVLAKILKEVRFHPKKFKATVTRLSQRLGEIESFLIPKRNLSQTEKQLRNKYFTALPRSQGTENKLLPPKLYVGKGYSDKGTARKPELDGTPSWQDIASAPPELIEEFYKRNKR